MKLDVLHVKLMALVISCRTMTSEEEMVNQITQCAEDIVKNCSIPNVVWQNKPCGLLHSTDWNGKCFKCGEQVFVREPK